MLVLSLPFFLQGLKIINWAFFVENFTLLRITHFDKIIPVAWTLSHEILFYLVFLVLIINRLAGMVLILGWFLFMLHGYFAGNVLMPPYILSSITGVDYGVFTNFARLVSSPINFLFALGAMSFLVYKRIITHPKVEKIAIGSFVIGIVIFFISGIYWMNEGKYENWGGYNAAFGIASFFLLIASGSVAIGKWASSQRIFLLLGNASYSIYIIHYGLQKYLAQALGALGSSSLVSYNLYFVILVTLPVALGVISYRYVELPMMRFFGRRRIK